MATQKTPADRLRELAQTIEAVTSEDYCDNAAELFDGSDVDTLRAVAAELDGSAAGQIVALQRRLANTLAMLPDVDCPRCGGEGMVHDCGDDTCCCADKSPNVPCPDCGGQG
jgi:hypothetical protein